MDTPRIDGADNRKLVGVGELARVLGLSERWIRGRLSRKELPCYRHGGATRFDVDEVLALMRRNIKPDVSESVTE